MNEKSQRLFGVFKWIAGIAILLFLCADAASWYLGKKLRPVITNELKDLVLHATDSLYRIEFSTVNTNFLLGNASILNLKIIPDTHIYHKLVKLKRAPNNIYEVRLKKLTIHNFHPYRCFREKKINVNELLFDRPSVVMINKQLPFNENKPARPTKSPYAYISRFLKEVSVRNIHLRDINFKYVNNNLPVPEIDSLARLNITLKDWLIDARSATDPNRFYLLKDVLIDLKDYQFATPDSLYHINVNKFSFRASTGHMNVKKFSLVPRYEEMEFGRVAGYAKDRFSIQMSDISLDGIDLPLYVKKQELLAREMRIQNGYVSVFNNNELKAQGTVRMDKFPHQLLQTMKGKLRIEKLSLSNIDLSYAEYDRDSKQKGKITFEKTSGTILNVTNEEKAKSKNPFMLVALQTEMMGQGKLDVNFRFDLTAKNGDFSYSGQLRDMDGAVLNRITKPLGMLEVRSGEVKRLTFDVKADNNSARGKMNFAYKDLSVGLLKKVEGKRRLVRQGLISMLANALVINPANPDAQGRLITAPIFYKRDPMNSFFSYVWKTMFQGIKYSVGLTPEKEAEIQVQIDKFEQMKADRDDRRDARQKRKSSARNRRTEDK